LGAGKGDPIVRRVGFGIVLALGTAGGTSSAADLHVDGAGRVARCDDAYTGTEIGQPLCSIGAALRIARPGDRIIVLEGTYRESVVPTLDGTAEAPIVIRSFEGETATISGTERIAPPARVSPRDDRSLRFERAERPLGFVQSADPARITVNGCPAHVTYVEDAAASGARGEPREGTWSWDAAGGPARVVVRVAADVARCERAGIDYAWLEIVREVDLSRHRHVAFQGIRFEDVTLRIAGDGAIGLDDCQFASASVTSSGTLAAKTRSDRELRRGDPAFPPEEPCGVGCTEPPVPIDPPLGLEAGGTGARDAENARANLGAASDDGVVHTDRLEYLTGAKVLAAPGIGLDVTEGMRAGSVGIGSDPSGIPGELTVGTAINLGANRAIYWPTFAPVVTKFFLGTTGVGTPLNGQDDNVICRAYNTDCSGRKFVEGEHTFKDQIEATFDSTVGPGIIEAVELNWDFSPDNTSFSWRPFGMFLDTTANSGDGRANFNWVSERGSRYALELRGNKAAFNRDGLVEGMIGRFSVFDKLENTMTDTTFGEYLIGKVRHTNDGRSWDYVGSLSDVTYDATSPTSALGGIYGLRTHVSVAGDNPGRIVNRLVGHEINLTFAGSGLATNWYGLDVEFRPTGANGTASGAVSLIHLASPAPVGPGTTIGGFYGLEIDDFGSIGAWGHAILVRTQTGGSLRGNIQMAGGGWNSGHLGLGAAHLWYDPTGQRLRVSTVTPNAATAGNAVVTGTGVDTYGPVSWAADGTSGTTACAAMGLTCVTAFTPRNSGTPGCNSTTDYRFVMCK
jgi:hypothetical protein